MQRLIIRQGTYLGSTAKRRTEIYTPFGILKCSSQALRAPWKNNRSSVCSHTKCTNVTEADPVVTYPYIYPCHLLCRILLQGLTTDRMLLDEKSDFVLGQLIVQV